MKRWPVLTAAATTVLVAATSFVVFRSKKTPSATPSASAEQPSNRAPTPYRIAEPIYDGKLMQGWEDWGWGQHELPTGEAARIVFGGYGGIVLHHNSLPAQYGALVFRVKAPKEFGDFLVVNLKSARAPDSKFPRVRVEPRHVLPMENGWNEVLVPWSELNPEAEPIDRITLTASRMVANDWVHLDKIALTTPTAPISVAVKAKRAKLSIVCGREARPISPFIYGYTNGVITTGGTGQRIGGNPLTRMNWDTGAWNVGSDWFFENADGGKDFWKWLDEGAKRDLFMATVVPMIGWVAKDTTSVGFPEAKFGKQQKHDPHRPEAGDGNAPNGSPLQPGPPTETSVEAPPELIGRWIRKLREKDKARGKRSVGVYILDNEPTLWDITHRDVHPKPVTYDELLERTIRYATAIRSADPEALIAGPAEWGWSGYHFSGKDRVAGTALRPDQRAHEGKPLIPWYLQKLAEHEKKTSVRLLDVVDVHYYPAADGLVGAGAKKDPETAALRLRSTRALWDPGYYDESWIKENIRLIPRMKEWVADNYPGRKLMIGEWSFGADDHISGGLATAEALGRFGQNGLFAAFYWLGPAEGTAAYWAFRAFRNFDGKGSRFLDWSLPTRETEDLSLFASRDESSSRIVAIVVNRNSDSTMNAQIDLENCRQFSPRRVFSYGARSRVLTPESLGESPPAGPGLERLIAPYSLQVIEWVKEE